MPRIPTQNQRQVREQVSQGKGFNARAGDTTSKVNLGYEVAGAIGKVAQIMEQEQYKAEESQALEYKLKLRNKKIELTHDKDKGFFKERGKNAAMNEKTYTDEFDQYGSAEIESFAGGSDRLKSKLSLIKKQFQLDLKQQYSTHTARENEVYESQMFGANMASLHNEALIDSSKIGVNIQSQKELIYGKRDKKGNLVTNNGVPVQAGFAAQKGLSKAQADQMFLGATTKMHSEQVTKMVDQNNPKLAQDYFDVAVKNKEVSEKEAVRLEKIIKSGSVRRESQLNTGSIMAQELTMSESLAEARSIDNPEVRDETVRRVKNRFAENKQIKIQESNEKFETISVVLEQDKSLDNISTQVMEDISNSERQALLRREKQLKSGEDVKTDLNVYYELEQLAAENKKAFLNTNLRSYMDKLSPSDFKKFSSLRKGLMSGKDSATELRDGLESKTSIVNGALKSMQIKFDSKANKKDTTKAQLFRKRVDQQVIDKQQLTGKKITNDELRTIVDDLKVDVVTSEGYIYDDTKPLFELEETETGTMKYESVPASQVEKIKATMKRRNIPFSEELVLKLYTQMLSKRGLL